MTLRPSRAFLLGACLTALFACSEPPGVELDGGPEPIDETCADDPCPTGERCVEAGDGFTCECPAGFTREEAECVAIEGCEPATCDGHGTCTEALGEVSCECDPGYDGARCGECDAGFLRNHLDACVADLCDPSPCTDAERRCVVVDGAAECACNAGTHDEGGVCVPDTVCMETTCSGRGTCVELDEGVACECGDGTAGAFCERCDEAAGYHDDGAGGCTTSVCLPSPCTEPLETVCIEGPDGAVCECDAGAHREGSACVPDEVCAIDTCEPEGICTVVGGRTECECASGYAGDRCEACATGYHDDGAGGCTDDVCTPSPCAVPNRSVCSEDGGAARCDCDPGYHEDGVGGCTLDPCVPNPCTASGQACRDNGGTPECYTPVCDDAEPCTDDTVVGGACVFTPRANGTACSTTLCVANQLCSGGVCGGGTAVTCEDGNPCTRGVCDATSGCSHVLDDTLVPDDGVACTVGTCSAGVASHTPSDARCSDGAFCNGAETCAPSDASADADGCIDGPAPVAPISTPCRSYGACNEASDSFPLTALPAGASCDDRIGCTTMDRCDAAGLCRGVPQASCAGECTGTTPWSAGVDVPAARLTGAITVAGAALPPTGALTTTGFELYLLNLETGHRHRIADPHYSYVGSAGYELRDATVDATIAPGVYDLLYERGYWNGSSSTLPYVQRAASTSVFPNGSVALERGLVIAAGTETLDVDIPLSRLTGSITVNGAALPPTGALTTTGFELYLLDRVSGQRHRIADPHYSYVGSAGYELRDATVDATIPPGVYDLVYERGYWNGSSATLPYVERVASTSVFPNGSVILRRDVTIDPGAEVLNVDVPLSRLTGSITVNGAALPPTGALTTTGFELYLLDRATGQRHRIADPHYSYVGSAGYELRDANVDATIPPGVYDLVYERGYWNGSSATLPYIERVASTSVFPNGSVVLRTDVTIDPGAEVLDVDVPLARLTGSITVSGGAALPPTGALTTTGFELYLLDRTTGQRHRIADPHYSYVGSAGYELRDANVDATIPPGVYDLVYERGYWNGSSATLPYIERVASTSVFPNGSVILQRDITINAGARTLNVDVPLARLTGSITVDGAALPPTGALTTTGFELYLLDRATGQRHRIADPHYSYVGSAGYELRDANVDATIPPGVYDLVYERGYWNGSSATLPYVERVTSTSVFPSGSVILQRDITIGAGARTLSIDVPSARLTGPITVEGVPLPTTGELTTTGFELYLLDRATGQRHRVGDPHYSYVGSAGYALRDPAIDATIVPGVYDLIYERAYWNGSSATLPYIERVNNGSVFPNANVRLRSCIAIP